jgi:hypothetical protein
VYGSVAIAARTEICAMRLLRHFLSRWRPRRAAAGYGREVLFSGWIELPAGYRSAPARRSPAALRSRSIAA